MLKKVILLLSLLAIPVLGAVLPTDYSLGEKVPYTELNQILAERIDDLIPIDDSTRDYLTATYNIGSPTYEWRDIYLSNNADFGTNTIYDGNLIGNWDFNIGNLTEIGNINLNGTPKSIITFPNIHGAPVAPNSTSIGDKLILYDEGTNKYAIGVTDSIMYFQAGGAYDFYTDSTSSIGSKALSIDTGILTLNNDSHGGDYLIYFNAEDTGGTNRPFTQTWNSDNRYMNFNSIMYIDEANSRVGIGLSAPSHALHVSVDHAAQPAVKAYNSSATGTGLNVETNSSSSIYFNALFESTVGNLLYIVNNGEVYMPEVYSDTVTGRDLFIASDGQLGYVSSSKTYKKNFRSIDPYSEKLYLLKPLMYDYKEKRLGDNHFGLIAEDVEKIMPELISYDKEGKPETVLYSKLVPLILNELIKQENEIDNLKKYTRRLNKKVKELQK